MILEADIRDLNVKTRKFRNLGKTIGIVERRDGKSIPISMTRSQVDKYLGRFGLNENMVIKLNGEEIKTTIIKVDRDVLLHYAHHIQLKEI